MLKMISHNKAYTLLKQDKNKPSKIYTPISVFYFLDLVQMDLIDVGNISEQNRGVKYLLCSVLLWKYLKIYFFLTYWEQLN